SDRAKPGGKNRNFVNQRHFRSPKDGEYPICRSETGGEHKEDDASDHPGVWSLLPRRILESCWLINFSEFVVCLGEFRFIVEVDLVIFRRVGVKYVLGQCQLFLLELARLFR